jgi:peptidoglycan/LPS O-acetylase OafA/YrhL
MRPLLTFVPRPERSVRPYPDAMRPLDGLSRPTAPHALGLDAIRVLAASMVFACHLALYGGVSFGAFQPVAENLRSGVILFFVLSGYLIFRPFTVRRQNLGSYAIRRFLRIYPAYVLALIGSSLLLGDRSFADHPLTYLLFLQNFDPALYQGFLGVSWTLQLEATFYLVVPVLAMACTASPSRSIKVLGALGELSLGAAILITSGLLEQRWAGNSVVSALFPFAFWAFVPGMVLAVLQTHRPDLLSWFSKPVIPVIGLGLLFLGSVVGLWATMDFITAGAGFLLVGWVIARDPGPAWLIRPIAAGAAISYAVYLWHEEVVLFLSRYTSGLPMLVLALAITTSIAAISYLVVERPLLRLARQLTRDRHRPTTADIPLVTNPA